MASVFLSPSTQDYNLYVTGNSEEYYTNLIADAMLPYLRASGIAYGRNDPSGTVSTSIALSNQGFRPAAGSPAANAPALGTTYNLHLAIHSNAAPEALAGKIRGSDVYYYRDSTRGKAAAEIFANNFKEIYPLPSMVEAVPTTTLVELRRTKAPAVLVELAYHDNVEDANWIIDNIEDIAENLALSVADFLGVDFREP